MIFLKRFLLITSIVTFLLFLFIGMSFIYYFLFIIFTAFLMTIIEFLVSAKLQYIKYYDMSISYKKRKILFIISFLILNSSFLISQETWIRTYNPFWDTGEYIEAEYEPHDILLAPDGGYLVAGTCWMVTEIDVDERAFVMKTDADGNFLWARRDSTDFSYYTEMEACAISPDGSIYTAGGNPRYLAKRTSEGELLWIIPQPDFVTYSMCIAYDEQVVLCGVYDDYCGLRKIDEQGNTIWTNNYSYLNNYTTVGFSVYNSQDEGFVITGREYDNDRFNRNVLLIKTNEVGDSLYCRVYDTGSDQDSGNSVIEATNGDIIALGDSALHTLIIKYEPLTDTLTPFIIWEYAKGYSVLEDDDGNYVGYSYGGLLGGTILFKFNSNGDIIWESRFSFWSAQGDRCFQKLPSEGFICGGSTHWNDDYFYLAKTDSVGEITGIEDNILVDQLKILVYPNPVQKKINFEFQDRNDLSNIQIEIYNIKGQLIDKIISKSGHSTVSWEAGYLPSGIYLYKIKQNKDVIIDKFLILK